MTTIHPSAQTYLGIPGHVFSWMIFIISLAVFSYVLYRRYLILRSGQKDPRFTSPGKRFLDLFINGFLQKRQPRYLWAGLIHIMIFWGFVFLGLRSIDLVSQGLGLPFIEALMDTGFGEFYSAFKDIIELLVLAACLWAVLRRALFKHERYKGSHTFEAYFILGLISFLMITDIFYEGSTLILNDNSKYFVPALYLSQAVLKGYSPEFISTIHNLSYWFHILAFFIFLDFLPLGKHFHIITALPNLFFRKHQKGSIKPARWDIEDIDELEALGIKDLGDFTWKHILDFLSCTECGRCSDNCPAYAIGRPLSPKMLTIKLRDYGYRKYPLYHGRKKSETVEDEPEMIGGVVSHDEIWSCTTCGACEEECPVFIEYIDKFIDMRRHLIETAQNPKTFNQILMQIEKTGNPFGKPAIKRADWAKESNGRKVKILKPGDEVDVLFFVDSYGSFDPTGQEIASSIVKGLDLGEIDFGILGPLEKDSGHQVRRMGEEGLFQLLVEENMETLSKVSFRKIITTDPHAFNTLKKDYPEPLEVLHYTQFFRALLENEKIKPKRGVDRGDVYTYHDPCYLGRHNGIYNDPREILHSIPGLKLVEMDRSRDRSFCCGGADVALWHEIEKEEVRMAEKRVQMAATAGANVIVTACPFCKIHFEDAVKTGGRENNMKVVDLMELFISSVSED